MTFSEWKDQLKELNTTVVASRDILDRATENRDNFLMSTIGYCPGKTATIDGTVDMISRIIEMKDAEIQQGKGSEA